VSDTTEEFYDDVTSEFPNVEHLAPSDAPFGTGRLVAIWAKELGTGKGNNGPYGYVETITLALDNGPDGTQVHEMVGEAPYRVEMRHSTGYLYNKLKGRVTGKHPKTGVPLKFRPLIGRVDTQASQSNKKVAAYGWKPMTDEDKVIVDRYKDMIISINKELEAEAEGASDAEAFE
jgi:hypothetical protein